MADRARHDDEDAAWGDFWAANRRPGGGGEAGCLPAQWQGLHDTLRRTWTAFAQTLPQQAGVLDLATGDGRVPAWMRQARADLNCVGIDRSQVLPPSPSGVDLRAGVSGEDMPFPDASFAAATSQFGFEYCNTAATANELLRVLKGGGSVALMVHRGDGAILAHNRARREQIGWVLDERDLVATARAMLLDPDTDRAEPIALAKEAAAEGERRFGRGAVGWEIPEAVRQSLTLGARDSDANVAGLLATIEERARNEMGRIASLARACAVADDRDALLRPFLKSGARLLETTELNAPDGKPFADFIRLDLA